MEALRSRWAGPISFILAAANCLAITGPSGAGKSVILRMIADLDPHTGGAWLDGRPRSSMRAPIWRRHVRHGPAKSGRWLGRVAEHF